MPAVKTSDVSCCRRSYVLISRRSIAGSTGGYVAVSRWHMRTRLYSETSLIRTLKGGGGGGIESVRIKRVEFRETKMSVSSGCP